MSDHEKFGINGAKPAWKKPSVTLTGTAKDVRGGILPQTFENPVYIIS